MEKQSIEIDRKIAIIFFIFFGVGILGHLVHATRELMLQLTPYILYVSISIVIMRSITFVTDRKKLQIWFIVAFSFGFICEVFGVKTGFPFGSYSYGSTLGFQIFKVPLVIGLNWMIVILGFIILFQHKYPVLLRSAAVGAGAVLFDFILEPVAISLRYWSWNHPEIPLQNYISWFFISFLLAFLFFTLKITIRNKLASWYLLAQFMFFTVLRILLV